MGTSKPSPARVSRPLTGRNWSGAISANPMADTALVEEIGRMLRGPLHNPDRRGSRNGRDTST